MERLDGTTLLPPPPSPLVHPHQRQATFAPQQHGMPGQPPAGYSYRSPAPPTKPYGKRKQSMTASLVENPDICAICLTLISLMIIVATLPFSLFFCIKVVQEYERAVIFRLGRLVSGGARGPGIFFIIPCIDTYSKADLRTVSFDVPPQEVRSRARVSPVARQEVCLLACLRCCRLSFPLQLESAAGSGPRICSGWQFRLMSPIPRLAWRALSSSLVA